MRTFGLTLTGGEQVGPARSNQQHLAKIEEFSMDEREVGEKRPRDVEREEVDEEAKRLVQMRHSQQLDKAF